MIGKVDDRNRALIDIEVFASPNSQKAVVTAWIDTAFDGHLVFSATLIERLRLDFLAQTEAILADGSKVSLDTFICYVNWFGNLRRLHVIANDGKLPLLGTGLLEN